MYKIDRRGAGGGVQKSFSRKLPFNFVHDHFIFYKLVYLIGIIGHVAAALGPLACASRSARPPCLS